MTTIAGIPVRIDPNMPADVIDVVGRTKVRIHLGPAEGEIVNGPHCPHCPHPLAVHWRERGTCMHSTDDEPWACDCNGPQPPSDDVAPGVPAP